ncbi:hypothetical protein CMV16_22850 [Peribacillus simplex]|nr:hypothetical protein CMV16_22850 [Peribacillus simplex]
MTKTNKTNKKPLVKWQIAECVGRLTPPPVLLKTKKEKVLTTGKKSNPIKDALFFILGKLRG